MTAPMPTRKKAGRPRRPYQPHIKKVFVDECELFPDVRFKHREGDRTGKRQGRLKFLYLVGRHYIRGNYWLCECKCGNVISAMGKREEDARKTASAVSLGKPAGQPAAAKPMNADEMFYERIVHGVRS